MDRIRRVGGEMEPARRPAGPRLLLPYEIQLCEAVGITAEEYWDFFDRVIQAKQERAKEYELVPDIRNGPILTPLIISVVVGAVSVGVSYLLAPKPKAPSQKKNRGERVTVEGLEGRSRYSPTYNFDAVQDLALVGSLPPLIFAKRENGHGGVRVKSQLLWSRLRSLGTHQELQALLMFGAGAVAQGNQPDFKGYQIGDQSLLNYGESRCNLVYMFGRRNQTRIDTSGSQQHDYDEGNLPKSWSTRFDVYWDQRNEWSNKAHSGTRTPTTSTSFGVYSPCPNGNGIGYPIDVIAVPPNSRNTNDARKKAQAKRKKNHESMAVMGCSFESESSNNGNARYRYIIRGAQFNPNKSFKRKYRSNDAFEYRGRTQYPASDLVAQGEDIWNDADGNDDGMQKSLQVREEADSHIQVGEQYMIGQGVFVCTELATGRDQPPFDGSFSGQTNKEYIFEEVPSLKRDNTEVNQGLVADPGPNSNFHGCETYNLMRCSIASVRTSRKVRQVEIGLKSVVWHQVQGLPNIQDYPGYETHNKLTKDGGGVTLGSVNAYRHRYSFFTLDYRKVGSETWKPLIERNKPFAIRGSTPEAMYNFIRISFGEEEPHEYEFRLMPLPGNVMRQKFSAVPMYSSGGNPSWASRGELDCYLFNPNARLSTITKDSVEIRYPGAVKVLSPNECSHREYVFRNDTQQGVLFSPNKDNNLEGDLTNNSICFFSAISDYFSRPEASSSHMNNPEHEVVYVNEMVEADNSPQYQSLNYVGLELRSAKEWSNFSNFSAYYKKGISVGKLVGSDEFGPTNLFPEIAHFLLTNKRFGAGQVINDAQVNKDRMTLAARFCEANGFYWDGIVDEKQNLREFIFANAGYNLLDFTIIGGKFSMVPSVPYRSDFTIDHDARPEIDALFTDGNTKNLKVTFLSPEERAPFVAELMWRNEEENGTAEPRTLQVFYDEDGGFAGQTTTPDIRDQIEVFDMSGFATTRRQCLKFAFTALKMRVHIDHSVQFDTTPEAAMGLAPGGYFRLVTEAAHIYPNDRGQRLMNGSIDSTGTVQGNGIEDGTYNIYYWQPSDESSDVREGTMTLRDGRCQETSLYNSLYSVRSDAQHDRVYKVETLSYSLEDGLVSITGSQVPLTDDGKFEILQDWPDLSGSIRGNDYFYIEKN